MDENILQLVIKSQTDRDYVFSNSFEFHGCIEPDGVEGFCTYVCPNGSRLQAEFHEGKVIGNALITWSDACTYRGEVCPQGIPHGKGEFHYDEFATYTGEFKNGKKHGQGRLEFVYRNGEKVCYEGEWKDDIRHGKGIQSYGTDVTFEGTWKNEIIEGEGSASWDHEGRISKSTGTWENGLSNGFTEVSWTYQGKENVYLGNYVDGKKTGLGTYYYAHGARYHGNFDKDKKVGIAEYITEHGVRIETEWKNDFPVENLPMELGFHPNLEEEFYPHLMNKKFTDDLCFVLDHDEKVFGNTIRRNNGEFCRIYELFNRLENGFQLKHIWQIFQNPNHNGKLKTISKSYLNRFIHKARFYKSEFPNLDIHDPSEKVLRREFMGCVLQLTYFYANSPEFLKEISYEDELKIRPLEQLAPKLQDIITELLEPLNEENLLQLPIFYPNPEFAKYDMPTIFQKLEKNHSSLLNVNDKTIQIYDLIEFLKNHGIKITDEQICEIFNLNLITFETNNILWKQIQQFNQQEIIYAEFSETLQKILYVCGRGETSDERISRGLKKLFVPNVESEEVEQTEEEEDEESINQIIKNEIDNIQWLPLEFTLDDREMLENHISDECIFIESLPEKGVISDVQILSINNEKVCTKKDIFEILEQKNKEEDINEIKTMEEEEDINKTNENKTYTFTVSLAKSKDDIPPNKILIDEFTKCLENDTIFRYTDLPLEKFGISAGSVITYVNGVNVKYINSKTILQLIQENEESTVIFENLRRMNPSEQDFIINNSVCGLSLNITHSLKQALRNLSTTGGVVTKSSEELQKYGIFMGMQLIKVGEIETEFLECNIIRILIERANEDEVLVFRGVCLPQDLVQSFLSEIEGQNCCIYSNKLSACYINSILFQSNLRVGMKVVGDFENEEEEKDVKEKILEMDLQKLIFKCPKRLINQYKVEEKVEEETEKMTHLQEEQQDAETDEILLKEGEGLEHEQTEEEIQLIEEEKDQTEEPKEQEQTTQEERLVEAYYQWLVKNVAPELVDTLLDEKTLIDDHPCLLEKSYEAFNELEMEV